MKKKTDLDKFMDRTAIFVKNTFKPQTISKIAMETAIAAIIQHFMFMFDEDENRLPPDKWKRR